MVAGVIISEIGEHGRGGSVHQSCQWSCVGRGRIRFGREFLGSRVKDSSIDESVSQWKKSANLREGIRQSVLLPAGRQPVYGQDREPLPFTC